MAELDESDSGVDHQLLAEKSRAEREFRLVRELHAALEDRDRLRAALKHLVRHVFGSDGAFEAALNEARAALEGRDG